MGVKVEAGHVLPWVAKFAPTQVQVVDLLQMLRTPPLDVGPRRLAIVLSAWDKVAPEGMTPSGLLHERMPLLRQYLSNSDHAYAWRVFGVSAQGGDYEPLPEAKAEWSPEKVEALLQLDKASDRIQIVADRAASHDLTEPIAWLME